MLQIIETSTPINKQKDGFWYKGSCGAKELGYAEYNFYKVGDISISILDLYHSNKHILDMNIGNKLVEKTYRSKNCPRFDICIQRTKENKDLKQKLEIKMEFKLSNKYSLDKAKKNALLKSETLKQIMFPENETL